MLVYIGRPFLIFGAMFRPCTKRTIIGQFLFSCYLFKVINNVRSGPWGQELNLVVFYSSALGASLKQ